MFIRSFSCLLALSFDRADVERIGVCLSHALAVTDDGRCDEWLFPVVQEMAAKQRPCPTSLLTGLRNFCRNLSCKPPAVFLRTLIQIRNLQREALADVVKQGVERLASDLRAEEFLRLLHLPEVATEFERLPEEVQQLWAEYVIRVGVLWSLSSCSSL